MKKENSIIILAAGKGVRMKSNLPKVLHEFNGKPMISRIVETAQNIKPKKIAVVVGYKKDVVIEALKNFDSIIFVEQKKQNGTGHAVLMTAKYFSGFDGNVVITPGDVPLLKAKTIDNLIRIHNEKNAAATVLTAILNDPTGYGRIIRDKNGYVLKIVEHKDASEQKRKVNEINSGIFCFDAKKLFEILPLIKTNNAQNELYLTDTLEILQNEGAKIAAVIAKDPLEISGINSPEQLKELESLDDSPK
ncbi:MAG: NTP transferase domain-containing protein [Candidatus Cloacimonadota bacterium]|nr:NTP transferase domain-containing protein [Candidatus Cloacimonadota bacterium]